MLDGDDPHGAWTPADTALAVALTTLEEDMHDCGWPLSIGSDPKLRMEWVSPPPRRCHACTERTRSAKPYLDDPRGRPGSLTFTTTLTPAGPAYLAGNLDDPRHAPPIDPAPTGGDRHG